MTKFQEFSQRNKLIECSKEKSFIAMFKANHITVQHKLAVLEGKE